MPAQPHGGVPPHVAYFKPDLHLPGVITVYGPTHFYQFDGSYKTAEALAQIFDLPFNSMIEEEV